MINNIMYGDQLEINENQNEGDIYEDLSHLLKIFKRMLDLSSQIVQNLEEQQVAMPLIQTFKELVQAETYLIKHYDYSQTDDNPHKNTVYRFVCRLLQTITIYISLSCKKSQASALHREFLTKTEQSVNLYQKDKNVGRIFSKIFHFSLKFCLSCEIILTQGFKEELLTYFSLKDPKTEEGEKESPEKMQKQSHQSESNFHKTMNALNKRFGSLSCLDLEYNSFKGFYFQARSQKQDLYRQNLHRNALIWKEISLYSKQFSEYLKKREKNNNRKNRLRDNLLKMNSIETSQPLKIKTEVKKISDRTFLIEEKERELPLLNTSGLKMEEGKRRESFNTSGHMKDEIRKTHYNINNVYLTLNKGKSSSTPGIFDKEVQSSPSPKKNFKERWNQYGPYKASKMSISSSKQGEGNQYRHKFPLEIRQVNSKDLGFMVIDKNFLLEEKKIKGKMENISKKSISEKKNIRIAQLINKSSITAKLQTEILNVEDLMIGQARTINCSQEEK